MSNAGGTPPPTTPLYRPRAGGPAPAIQRSSPENSSAAQWSSPKKSQGIQRKLTRRKRPQRRTTARFAAQRLLSTRPAATPERARGEVAGPPSKTPMTARSGEPWSQKGGTVVTRLRRVTKASDSMVSLRRLRPSWGGDLALTKGTFLAMLVGHYTRLGGLVANSA